MVDDTKGAVDHPSEHECHDGGWHDERDQKKRPGGVPAVEALIQKRARASPHTVWMTRFAIVQIRLTQTLGRKSVEGEPGGSWSFRRTPGRLVEETHARNIRERKDDHDQDEQRCGRSRNPVEEPPPQSNGIASGGSRSNRISETSLVLAMGGLDAAEQGEGTLAPFAR